MPSAQVERLEQPRQQRRIGQLRRHEAHRVFRAGGQRVAGAGHFAGQLVEDRRFADVRPADDGHDQQWRQIKLRQQLVLQQIEPLLANRRGHARRDRLRLQGPDPPIEPSHLRGERLVVGGHSTPTKFVDSQ